MRFVMEGRVSSSPYIEMVWRGGAFEKYSPTCPANSRWDLLFYKKNGKTRVSVEGPLTKAHQKTHLEDTEWLVIKFKLGIFMPHLPMKDFLDGEAVLPEATGTSFWLNGSVWKVPDFENVETFVDRLARENLLLRDPVVQAVLKGEPPKISLRTVRRRFLQITGLTHGSIRQIERAQQAMDLLAQGVPILDAVYEAGYADQPHMTRSLKRYIGETPAQIALMPGPINDHFVQDNLL